MVMIGSHFGFGVFVREKYMTNRPWDMGKAYFWLFVFFQIKTFENGPWEAIYPLIVTVNIQFYYKCKTSQLFVVACLWQY